MMIGTLLLPSALPGGLGPVIFPSGMLLVLAVLSGAGVLQARRLP